MLHFISIRARIFFIITKCINAGITLIYIVYIHDSMEKQKYVRVVRLVSTSLTVTIPSKFKVFKPGDEVWVTLNDDETLTISKVSQ